MTNPIACLETPRCRPQSAEMTANPERSPGNSTQDQRMTTKTPKDAGAMPAPFGNIEDMTTPQGRTEKQSPRDGFQDAGMTPNRQTEKRANLEAQPVNVVFMATEPQDQADRTASSPAVQAGNTTGDRPGHYWYLATPEAPQAGSMTLNPSANDDSKYPRPAMPALDVRTGGMKPPLEVARLCLHALAFVLLVERLRGVDGPPLVVDVFLAGLAFFLSLWPSGADRDS